MIALGMAYALVVSALFALTALMVERAARRQRWATRVVWAAAIAAMVLVSLSAVGPSRRGEPTRASNDKSPRAAAPERVGATPVAAIRDLGTEPSEILTAKLLAEAERLAGWDRVLLGGWVLLAAFLAGVVTHAALEGRRLQYGLEKRSVGEAEVFVTDWIGPAAVGTLSPRILLPRWALELDDPVLSLVVRHEREHLAARDPLVLLLALIAGVLVPWNLPLWWACRRLRLATEVDCDARVLKAFPDVRRYAQLLLLTAQRTSRIPWASRPVVAVAAPLNPRPSQLASRIHAMTQPRAAHTMLGSALVIGAATLTATIALALPAPHAPPKFSSAACRDSARSVVHLTSVGLQGVELAGDSLASPILIYATGPACVGLGDAAPVPLTGTMKLYRLPAITADVTDADVHIALTGPGSMEVRGPVTGGRASSLGATSSHIVLLKGGVGVRTLP